MVNNPYTSNAIIVNTIQKRMLNYTSQIIWILFHIDIKGNEEAD